MIWGEAGIGKSTLCQKLSQDWALVVTGKEGTKLDNFTEEQRRKLNNIELLFNIVLRNTDPDQTIELILKSQFGLLEGQLELLKSYEGNVTLILDGFDELSYDEGHIIDLIQGKLDKNIACIITCRPHASTGIVLNTDLEIMLKGFTESQSKSYIERFARNRIKTEKDVNLFISETSQTLTSSEDLIEMSTNPSMLQLICFLSLKTRKLGKDRAEVFRNYTQYLLIQFHSKHHEGVPYSDDLYKDFLLKSGKLAILGLKHNHLQLIFSKKQAIEVAGSIIFDLGFLMELPSTDSKKVKVQFTHKSLQEYLAAFYVVNTPGDDGMKVLMEFCSTTQRLMGSQIILSFIAAMSKRMNNVIKNQIKDYICTWKSNDDVDPKSRTSFLVAMLKDDKKLTFPLPTVLDIDLSDHDSVRDRITNFMKSIIRQKSTLEKFLNMDARGVKKINIGVGQYNRLGVLLNNSFTSLEELLINYKNTWFSNDPTHLTQVITTNKPSLISITNCGNSLFNKDLITKVILSHHVDTVFLKKCQVSKDNCILILQYSINIKSLSIQECGIKIDADIAKVVCRLPDETKIDLSGNSVVKMDKQLLTMFINKIKTQKQIDLSGLNIDVDAQIAKTVCDLPEETRVDLSGNQIVKMDIKLLTSLIRRIRTQKQIDLGGANIDIDTDVAKAICDLPLDTQVDLSGNKINRFDRKIVGLIVTQIRKKKQTDFTRFNIEVDSKLINAICDIPGDIKLDLSENKIFQINPRILMLLIYRINTLQEINLSGLNAHIDEELVNWISQLPEDVQIDLSGNKITDESLIVSIIKQSTKLKSVAMRNCGIKINKQIAEAVSGLNDDTKLDLSCNDIEKMDAGLLGKVLKYMKQQEKIYINNWSITIDVDIVKALSNMVYLKSMFSSYNKLTPSACKFLIHSVRSLPQLEHLALGRCDVSNDDCVDLVSSLSKHCPRLEYISLCNNHLSSGVSQVVDDVSKMNNLTQIGLAGNPCVRNIHQIEALKNRLKKLNPQVVVVTTQ